MANNTLSAPGVFRGQARLATQQELADLKAYIESKLTGPLMELSENGYIPWVYNEAGHLDIDYLFPELVAKINEQEGIDIQQDGLRFADNIKSININGKYARIKVDENGVLVITIDEPAVTLPSFNEANHFNSAIVSIDNELVSGMIIPSRDGNRMFEVLDPYGDWEAGQVVSGINWNGTNVSQEISFSTAGPVLAESTRTYFEIIVTAGGADGEVLATYTSNIIAANTPIGEAMYGNNIYVSIRDFKDEANNCYSFMPKITIDILKIMQYTGGRFRVKIIHHSGSQEHTYISPDYLFNKGVLPKIGSMSVDIITDQSSSSSRFKYASGLKYANYCTAMISLVNVSNLNNMAAIDDPLSYDFGFLELAGDDAVTVSRRSLAFDNVCDFSISLKIANNILNTEPYDGSIVMRNAFGGSNRQNISIPILVNSLSALPESDDTHEYFSDESYRVLSNFAPRANSIDNFSSLQPWESSQSLITYDSGKGLMVVPGQGLMYPHGNWSGFKPDGNPNYSAGGQLTQGLRFFCRQFGSDMDSRVKFGGVFRFEGVTTDQLLNNSNTFILMSSDKGDSWYDLKSIRNTTTILPGINTGYDASGNAVNGLNVTGVLTGSHDKDGYAYIEWSYPKNDASPSPIWFKIGFTAAWTYCIKSITLLNTDEEEDW